MPNKVINCGTVFLKMAWIFAVPYKHLSRLPNS